LIPDLKEMLRRELLRILKRAHLLGLRNEMLLSSIRIHPSFSSITEEELKAEVLLFIRDGYVSAEPVPMAPGAVLYRITERGEEFCYQAGIN
jgi:hypothetical protein